MFLPLGYSSFIGALDSDIGPGEIFTGKCSCKLRKIARADAYHTAKPNRDF